LGGAALFPGITDAHGHLSGLGEALRQLDLSQAHSPEEVARRVARCARELPAEAWILGRGWDQESFPDRRFPEKAILDVAAPGHLVFLERVDGHAAWVSSTVLARAGINSNGLAIDPNAGRILRDVHGEPTGVLIGAAMDLAKKQIARPTRAELDRLMLAATERCASLGITQVHDAGLDLDAFEALERLAREQRLPIRVYAMEWSGDPRLDQVLARGPVRSLCQGMLALCAIKVLLDGALGSRGAALNAGYCDEPMNRGLLAEPEKLFDRVRDWAGRGFQVAIHAIGDQANALALDALERVGRPDLRPRIEHAQVLRPGDVDRFGRLGIIASMQPAHWLTDSAWAERRLGAQRLRGAYAWRPIERSGGVLVFGSDFPVADANPLLGLLAATSRPDRRDCLSRLEALRAYTAGAAFASFTEAEAGRIVPGMRADLTAFTQNVLESLPEELLQIRPVLAVVAGRTVFSARS
jgi:predicted amidohydrolase YtcJ